jgi:pimeloyl-ACP methyl ester carboxylesterase
MKAVPIPAVGQSIRYLEIPGLDPPLLWLHGLMCSSTAELLPVAVEPALRGRHSLVIDLLGYGYSDKPDDFGYSLDDHADTVLALLDTLALTKAVLIGHSMGGTVATLVAAKRPTLVSVLVLAEAELDPGGAPGVAAQGEEEFVGEGFPAILAGMRSQAQQDGLSIAAMHLGMTEFANPRAVHRGAVSLQAGTTPPMRQLLADLRMPRFYLKADASDKGAGPQDELVRAGVVWKTVADSGHAMGLQNPSAFAQAIDEVLRAGDGQ